MTHPPADTQELQPWFNVIRRLRSISHTRGYAILAIRILVDPEGRPVQWSEPDLTLLEPSADGSVVDTLLATLAN